MIRISALGINHLDKSMLILMFSLCFSGAMAQNHTNMEHINQVLENTLKIDQEIRSSDSFIGENADILISKINTQDSINRSIVIPIIEQYGWYDSISKRAADCYFYVIQHSPIEIQIKYRAFVDAGFNGGHISKPNYAMYSDRLLIKQSKYQIYGTQTASYIQLNSTFFYPIVDVANLDERRIAMELEPIYDSIAQDNNLLQFNAGDVIVILGHIAKQNLSVPISDAFLFVGDTYVTKTNKHGFFQFIIPRPMTEAHIPIGFEVDGSLKKLNYLVNNSQDFYELNISL